MKQIVIGKNEAQQRLDKLLIKYLNKAPKSFIYKMLRKKNITLNGKKADGSEKLSLGDTVILYLSDETVMKFSQTAVNRIEHQLDILYEDEHILILNKEAGLLAQKSRPGDVSLIEHITSYLLDAGSLREEDLAVFRPGLCNRLDRNTSGIIVAGKSLAGLQAMAELFKSRNMDKYYLCIVKGRVEREQSIDGYLTKNTSHNKVSITREPLEGAEYIRTEYCPVRSNGQYTLLKVKLITGKSHQIRAHLQSIGHPVAGDGKYGDVLVNRYFKRTYQLKHHLLHSSELSFPKLDGVLSGLSGKTITAPLPGYFARIEQGEFKKEMEDS